MVTAFVSMAIIKLLFVFLGTFSRRCQWWKKIGVWMHKIRMDGPTFTSLYLARESYNSWCVPKRGRNPPDEAAEGIEMTEKMESV
jgi:hypothetical protein